ncbi:MAG: chemotaxis protein CheD [Deltaproteobacteria bacterium]
MSDLIAAISDIKISNNADDVIITYALGSCIGITVYDPVAKVGGLLHYMLPDSMLDEQKAREKPAMFADTGIPLLFKSCYAMGAEKKRMIVSAVGGASILDDANFFRIGQKNIMAMRKIFWKNNVMIKAEDTGSNYNRTVRLEMRMGKVFVRSSRGEMKEL